jgi:hypothetical protein
VTEEATIDPALLDQYPSAWLQAHLARVPQWPKTRDDLVRQPQVVTAKKRPLISPRLLNLAFLPLTLFAMSGITGSLVQIAEDPSFDLTVLLTVAFAVFITYGLYTQVRGLLITTPFGRRFLMPEVRPLPAASALLLGQSDAVTVDASSLMTNRRGAVAAARSRRAAERVLPFVVLLVAVVAAATLVFFLVYGTLEDPALDADLLMSGVFAGFAVFGSVQFARMLGKAGWRGSPVALTRRAFYDSNRLYSGAHSLTQLGISSAATAVVVAAGVGPVAFPSTPQFTLFGFDANSGSVYNVKPEDGSLLQFPVGKDVLSFSPMGSIGKKITLADGSEVSKTAALTVVTTRQGQFLVSIGVRTGLSRIITRIGESVDVAGIGASSKAGIVLVEHRGLVRRLDPHSGQLTSIGSIGREIDVAGFDRAHNRFVALSGADVLAINLENAQARTVASIPRLAEIDACGVAGIARGLIVADRTSSTLFAFDSRGELIGTIGPSPLNANVCGIVAVQR